MKAIVKSVRKETLPRFDRDQNKDVPTLMVVADVEFYNDNNEWVHSQTYAQVPEDVDPGYYQRQADAMQADLDHAKAQAEANDGNKKRNAVADEKIDAVRKHHKLDVHDSIPLNDRG